MKLRPAFPVGRLATAGPPVTPPQALPWQRHGEVIVEFEFGHPVPFMHRNGARMQEHAALAPDVLPDTQWKCHRPGAL